LSVSTTAALYRRHRFPGEIISYAVWLYYRFTLSYRDIEVLLAERGVQVTYESIRQWCGKFGPIFAAGLRQRRPAARPKWHLDEVFIRIRKQTYYLWRAVDQDGLVLDILVQERRNQEAAERFLRRVVAGEPGEPRVVVTDKLASYHPAIKKVLPHTEHRQHKGLNNRAENSHLPTRQRERRMRRFKSPGQAQRFLEPFGPISDHFCPRRHLLGAAAYRRVLAQRFLTWRAITSNAA
jgi:putative transposase